MWSRAPKKNIEPKLSIKCHVFKGSNMESEMVVVQRKKEPYYGFHGVMASSVKYEKTLLQNVTEELPKKLGLISKDISYLGVANVINKINEEVVDSKIFHLFVVFNATGSLISPEGYNNFWLKPEEFLKIDKIHYGQREIFQKVISGNKNIYIESVNNIDSL
ncbi:MAG: hypothetical protein Q9M91_03320 [Candidatus Dojkabacteria bacterium]|nr:hypothetical protein [Candidatus Dojkabacteria bacterium]